MIPELAGVMQRCYCCGQNAIKWTFATVLLCPPCKYGVCSEGKC